MDEKKTDKEKSFMKIYELEAEETGFKLFHHRDVKDLYPHFHSVYGFFY